MPNMPFASGYEARVPNGGDIDIERGSIFDPLGRLAGRGVASLVSSGAVPKSAVWAVASHYIAGEHLDDAVRVVEERTGPDNVQATIDVLGEAITTKNEAKKMLGQYEQVIDRIAEVGLKANVSVKPTALGLDISTGTMIKNLDSLLKMAAEAEVFVRLEAEQERYARDTHLGFRVMHQRGYGEGIGIVMQACLGRTAKDIHSLTRNLGPIDVRLVKGIYQEKPGVGLDLRKDYQAVREWYMGHVNQLANRGSTVSIASHDEWIIDRVLFGVMSGSLPEEKIKEFQMLYGVREDLADRLIEDGEPFRLYVPFGEQWLPYSQRRFKENPHLFGTIAGDVVRRMFKK